MEVLTAEFLPNEKQLFIVVADSECNIHILEFNPEDPKSLGGHSLLHRSTFHTGHFPSSMTLLPSSSPATVNTTLIDDSDPATNDTTTAQASSVLMISPSGAFSLLTSLPESTYRRLFALQNHLITILDHPCGLNPRAYRAVESQGSGGRGVLDGSLLRRWTELSSQKKIEACKRIGEEMETVRGWLKILGGGELGYL
jgi:cleavage and polyadenylation specificity factor subunit 1